MAKIQAFPPNRKKVKKDYSLVVTEEDQIDVHAPPIMMKFKSLGHKNFNT